MWVSVQVIGGLLWWATCPVTPQVVNGVLTVISGVGASGITAGLFGAICIRFLFQRTWQNVVIAAVLGLLYGVPILLSLIPGGIPVAWQAHLFGLLTGVAAGLLLGLFYRKYPYRLAGTATAQPTNADNPFETPFDVRLHDASKTSLSSNDFEL